MQENTKEKIYSLVKSIVLAIVIVFICRQFLVIPVAVHGESMEPTFEAKNRLIVSKISKIDRFDIVVFQAPDEDEQYIKRVIGLPGDQIEMSDDILYVNGNRYEEPYVKRESTSRAGRITGDFSLHGLTGYTTIPEGYFFVLGDNRLRSKDSREFGLIAAHSVVGEVKFRIYPFGEMGIPK